ncbi:hypothetical protein IFDJLNFL_5763 [Methylobacterium dankookense]|uniref:Uncharacterized protein n=1 Tax=Methylobacterium dankookense TaxID=560405 RepID=A0ABQ4RPU2_9HYPH|nr:hypothetical protein IFDJLNFL_5763 [Methylobacterium dankookense]
MPCGGRPNSVMSAPPQNSLPEPVSTMARIAGSAPASAMRAARLSRRAEPSAFTGGFARVITATRPSRRISVLSLMPSPLGW